MENRRWSSVVAFVLSAFLAWCTLAGCSTTRWMGVEPGEYVVGRGQGEAHEAAARVIQKMQIDRDERVAVFTLVDGSEIVASFVPRDRADWPPGCPTNIYTHRMEVLDIEEDTLTIESVAFSHPILVRSCPPDPVFVVLREDGKPGSAISFKPKRDFPWKAHNSTVSTAEDTPVTIDIIASDFEVGGFLDPETFAVASGPANGTIVNNFEATGTIASDTGSNDTGSPTYRIIALVTYTPNPGFAGTDTFTYRICDRDGYCDTATVTVIVNPSSSTGR
jgi:hypothetical protein